LGVPPDERLSCWRYKRICGKCGIAERRKIKTILNDVRRSAARLCAISKILNIAAGYRLILGGKIGDLIWVEILDIDEELGHLKLSIKNVLILVVATCTWRHRRTIP